MMSATSSRTPVTAAINSTTPSGATLPVSGAVMPGRGANRLAAPLYSQSAGGRVLSVIGTSVTVQAG